jgi:hypothetical protein
MASGSNEEEERRKENDERLCQQISERERWEQLQYGNCFMLMCAEKVTKTDEVYEALLFGPSRGKISSFYYKACRQICALNSYT